MPKESNSKATRYQQLEKYVESIESKSKAKRSRLEVIEDKIVSTFGTIEFLVLNFLFFIAWIALNSRSFPFVEPFDPYPFIMLTTIVSLEAIILAIFVLITQNRQAKISSLREEAELQINLISEQEVTKILKVLAVALKKLGVDSNQDPELQNMIKPLNPEEIEKQLEEQLGGN